MMPGEMEDRSVPISSAEHSFIYLFIYLLSWGGCWKLWSLQEERRSAIMGWGWTRGGGAISGGIWQRDACVDYPCVWEVGDQTEGRGKYWHSFAKRRMIIELPNISPKHANTQQPGLNRVISSSDDFGRAVFLIYYTTSSSSQTPSLREDQCPQRIQFLQWLGTAKKVTMNLIKDDFSVLSLRRTSAKTRHQVALKGLLWAQRMRCRCTSKHIPALGILCQSGHLGCTVTNQDKQDHQRCYL